MKYRDIRKAIKQLEEQLGSGAVEIKLADGSIRQVAERDIYPIFLASMQRIANESIGLPIPESPYNSLIDAIRTMKGSNENGHLLELIATLSGPGFATKDGSIVSVDWADMPALQQAARDRVKGKRTEFDDLLDRLCDKTIGELVNWSNGANTDHVQPGPEVIQ